MALRSKNEPANISDRFGIAQDGYIPDDISERQTIQLKYRALLYEAVVYLNRNVEDSRELSLALTKAEESLLWAGKAIFRDDF